MKYTAFHEQRFRDSVDQALKNVKTILDTTRNPRLAAEESHAYDTLDVSLFCCWFV
jgi:hypothetical protein